MELLRRTQRWLGGLSLLVFALTGLYMAQGFPGLHGDHEGIRMMYRATHLYILLTALINLAVGLHPPRAALSGRALPRYAEVLEGAARVGLMLAPAMLAGAFFTEPASYDLERPMTFWAIVLTVTGALSFAFVGHLGPAIEFLRRRLTPRRAALAPPTLRAATEGDLPTLQVIRAAAFAPVFASFRAMLGDAIYERAQRHEDEAQAGLLASLLDDEAWSLLVAELDGAVVGFVSVRLDAEHLVGEIGLNAVAPAYAGRGVGTAMYRHALDHMRRAEMQVATVATGGDASHAPARRAYEKVGFDRCTPGVWMCRQL